jgi:hypothetical protein
LKQNHDASVRNKELGENESGKPVEDLPELDESVLQKQFSITKIIIIEIT